MLKKPSALKRQTKKIKDIFEEPTAKQLLINNGLAPDQINKYFSLASSITKETRLTMFQYKILHDIVFTKNKLFKAKLASSDLCYLCLKTKQDLRHMLDLMSGGLWVLEAFLDWYETHTSTKLELSTVKILYAIISDDNLNTELTNHLLLLAKYYIYCCSFNEEPFVVNQIVINKAEIEKKLATSTNLPEHYYNK